MLSKASIVGLALAAGAAAQTTTTATILIPDWCVTQSVPTVTVLGSGDLTTYSYSCSIDSAAVSSASAKASSIAESAQAKASELKASLATLGKPKETDKPDTKRWLQEMGAMKRDSSYECFGWDAFDACIPWEITQGPSFWAVHYTATDVGGLDQECTFGDGGVENGPATCTASGRLDPNIWGDGDDSHTHTFEKTDVDEYFIRNTVPVTAGGEPLATGGGPATTGTVSTGTGAAGGNATGTGTLTSPENAFSTGHAASLALPTGAVAIMGAAGGILAAALAL